MAYFDKYVSLFNDLWFGLWLNEIVCIIVGASQVIVAMSRFLRTQFGVYSLGVIRPIFEPWSPEKYQESDGTYTTPKTLQEIV